jgi:hypothetical protein
LWDRGETRPEGGNRRETRVDTSELMMLNWRGRQSQSCALLPLLQMPNVGYRYTVRDSRVV